MRPFGYFVHHQGRGHATRCAAVVNALPAGRPVTVFCARDDIFPPLREGVTVRRIPSLFEPDGTPEPPALAAARTPANMHCAPLGWARVRGAMAALTAWFHAADPELMIVDVSAEVAQLARLCSVPVVKVLQHGDRSDDGHMRAYESAAGLLAPYAAALEQPERPAFMRAMTHYAGGLGVGTQRSPGGAAARRAIGAGDAPLAVVISGEGGSGTPLAPLAMAARALPEWRIVTIGRIAREGHETEPGNLVHHGWTDMPETYLAAADLVIASTGNTTCHQILAAGRPWIAIPEWRYFEEQLHKARALHGAGAAHMRTTWPGTPQGWRAAVEAATAIDPAVQRALVDPDAADRTADWLEGLAARLWAPGAEVAVAAE